MAKRTKRVAWGLAVGLTIGLDSCLSTAAVADPVGLKPRAIATLRRHHRTVTSLAFSPNGRSLASGSWDKTVRLWEMPSGKLQYVFRDHPDWVQSVTFQADGRVLAAASGSEVHLWDTRKRRRLQVLRNPGGFAINSVVFHPSTSLLAVASQDRRIRLWDTARGRLVQTIQESFGPYGHYLFNTAGFVWAVRFSPNGKSLASVTDDGGVRVWEVGSGRRIQTYRSPTIGPDPLLRDVAFSPDGQTLACANFTPGSAGVELWHVATARPRSPLRVKRSWPRHLAFRPDGQLLAVGENSSIRLWHYRTGALVWTLGSAADGALIFSPNGRLLATASGNEIQLWQVPVSAIGLTSVAIRSRLTRWPSASDSQQHGAVRADRR